MRVVDCADQREFSFDFIWVRCKHRGQKTPVQLKLKALDVMQLAKKTIKLLQVGMWILMKGQNTGRGHRAPDGSAKSK